MRLVVEDVHKSYAGVEVLHGITLDGHAGEVLAISGANGAGKSTLINILSGATPLDRGRISIDGHPVVLRSPHDAHSAGIRTVHQELSLVPQVSITENLLLGELPTRRSGVVDWRAAHARARELLTRVGFGDVDPRRALSELSVAQQQLVEIAKALTSEPRVLILDEPSAVLAGEHLDRLFEVVDDLRRRGVLVLYVSHRLGEVMQLADRVSVIKDGRLVSTVPTAETSEDEIVRAMAGRRLDQVYPDRDRAAGAPVLRVRGLTRTGAFEDVTLTVGEGEVVGVFGLVGSGRSEVAHCIFGAEPATSGTVEVGGSPVVLRSPRQAIAAGVALVTEDRKRTGLVLPMTVQDNTTLATMRAVRRRGLLDRRRQRAVVDDAVRRLDVRPARPTMPVVQLSGGNQQKVVLAKWLLTQPRVLILDEPTRGVDMAARVEIYRLIDEQTRSGLGVLLISSDLTEVLGASDRVLVMHEGRVVGERRPDDTDEDELLALAVGVAA
ncbi:sugar ABC transporter ATP-binding protein [Geodermatophilus sp. DSM 44513]|uniref:sugar ABC transporter ATP-binding protein n=1 Tax=Geodermatophilus sp. DSM 44513 TaxID=1528104 RepID=UPI001285BC4C|nr:sugar ABC transporter ATP-binding protein [Geodermatophilus sp. DSM 44513]WNV75825.1 sugar ABC transporter ATP-binding protein [Geodermatophilus sp. DSM 44513]